MASSRADEMNQILRSVIGSERARWGYLTRYVLQEKWCSMLTKLVRSRLDIGLNFFFGVIMDLDCVVSVHKHTQKGTLPTSSYLDPMFGQ